MAQIDSSKNMGRTFNMFHLAAIYRIFRHKKDFILYIAKKIGNLSLLTGIEIVNCQQNTKGKK